MGHIASQCRKRGRAAPREAASTQSPPQSVNALVTEKDATITSKHEKVTDLKQQLREAEIDVALSEVTVTMHHKLLLMLTWAWWPR